MDSSTIGKMVLSVSQGHNYFQQRSNKNICIVVTYIKVSEKKIMFLTLARLEEARVPFLEHFKIRYKHYFTYRKKH